jgi:predicted transcriptional regulator
MSVLRVGIASYAEIKERTLGIARGKLKPKPDEPKIWFASTESLGRVLSEENRALLGLIRESGGKSLTELAKLTGREKSNLSRTMKTMEHYGILKLNRSHGKVVAKFPYQSISIAVPVEGPPKAKRATAGHGH